MDVGKVFVLILTAFAVGILAYLELKSRRSRQELDRLSPEINAEKTATPRKS